MLPPLEVLAMVLILGLYLQDSLLLLYDNEAVLERVGGGAYRPRFGPRSFHLGGRIPFVPNPFTPWRAVFRFAWHDDAPAPRTASAGISPETVAEALRTWRWGTIPIAAGLFIGLPVCLYFNLRWTPFLILVAVTYAAAVAMVFALWRQRTVIALGRGAWMTLAFEALICLPCALNLPRKVSSRIAMQEDFLDAARARLPAAALDRVRAHILECVDESLAAIDTDHPRWETLNRYRSRVAEHAA